jgi:competence CoiA-like predicted nuclease
MPAMAKNTECLISIELANAINQLVYATGLSISRRDIGFRCPECGKPVNPHLKGKGIGAHFEHTKANKKCSRSYY